MSAIRGLAVDVRAQKAATQDVTEKYGDTSLGALGMYRARLQRRTRR